MATQFPGDLDSLLNPQPTDSVAAVSHAAQHADANDAIEALQVKVGKDNSADVNSIDYRLRFLENNPVTSEVIQDAIADAFAAGDQSQVTVSYNDESNAITLLVNQAQTAGYTSQVKHYVKNSSGSTINIGTPVYVSGAAGTNILITPASNIAESSSSKTLGLLAQTLANNTEGFVVAEGLLAGLNTSSANAGDPVWLGPNGTLIYGLANKPFAPNHLVFIGIVTRSQSNNGEIFVKVQNGFELKELHDVSVQSPTNQDALVYDSSLNLWKNYDLTQFLATKTYVDIAEADALAAANNYTDIQISGLSLVYDPIGSASAAEIAAKAYADSLASNYDPSGSAAAALIDANEYTDFAVAGLGNSLPTIYVPISAVGNIDGVASLDSAGKVPASQLDITETIQDVAAGMITGATHTNISVSYDDNTGRLSLTGIPLTQEQVQDFVAPLFNHAFHTNITASYDDANNRILLQGNSGGGSSLTQEEVQDFVAPLLNHAFHTNISATYDDVNNRIVLQGNAGGGGGGASVIISPNPPSTPGLGDIWLDSDNGKTYIWDGAYWIEVGAGNSQAVAAVTSTPPSSPVLGAIWMNPTTAKTYIYDGSFWAQI